MRAEAVRYLKTGMDLAASLGCHLVTICPLADALVMPVRSYLEKFRGDFEDCIKNGGLKPEQKLQKEPALAGAGA